MKIGILTYYGVHNHGAVLQANALKNVLTQMGHQCGFLMFERDYANVSERQVNKYKLGWGSISFYFKYLIDKGPSNIIYNAKKRRVLAKFRAQYIPLICNYKEFHGDLVVIGSDEVFSLEIGVNPFMYGNEIGAKHIISYAASFGPTNYEDILKQGREEMIVQGLRRMDAISVRDQNSLDIVRKISDIQAALVCDPVLLYGYQEEMNSYVPPLKRYILVYSYDKNLNDEAEYHYILNYAQKRGLEVVSVGYYHKWCRSINVSPFELLGWIKNSDLVVTDTFHGAVMSILCNTSMVVKLRNNKNKLACLLSEYGLENRMIATFSCFDYVADEVVDFTPVNRAIIERRESSMKYLESVLKQCQ